MPCYHPVPAWTDRRIGPNRKFGVTFRKSEAWTDRPISLPCGKCIGCRIKRANEWGTRCMNELRDYRGRASFITLTYTPENLPPGGTLRLTDLQKFLKRVRKAGHQIRYFAAGEYGERTQRPHYHLVVFGYMPHDRVHIPGNRTIPLYRSRELTELWGLGDAKLSPVTRENATYVAKYTLSKYDETGNKRDFAGRQAPFLTMSTHPGIGSNYAREHARALVRLDGIRLRGGQLAALPRYYEKVIARHDPESISGLKTRRKEKADTNDTLETLLNEPQLHQKETNAHARQTLNRKTI